MKVAPASSANATNRPVDARESLSLCPSARRTARFRQARPTAAHDAAPGHASPIDRSGVMSTFCRSVSPEQAGHGAAAGPISSRDSASAKQVGGQEHGRCAP